MKYSSKVNKASLLKLNIALLLSCAISSPAFAQNNENAVDKPSNDAVLDEVVVFGTRLQNRRAIGVKRDQMRILDAIAADEIGSLPDDNAAEAIQRVPGVSIEVDQAEGRFVTIRALNADFNFVTVDGGIVASPDRGGRRAFMDVFPSALAKRIEVVKSFTPDLDAEAIGGHINFVSRSAFDYDDDVYFKFKGRLGEYDNNKGPAGTSSPSSKFEGVYAQTFGAEDQFGVVVTADYYRRDSYSTRNEGGSRYRFYDDAGNRADFEWVGEGDAAQRLATLDNGMTFVDPASLNAVPDEQKLLVYHNDRQRKGFSARLDWQLNDDTLLWGKIFSHTGEDDEERTETKFENEADDSSEITFASPTSGTITDSRNTVQLGTFDFKRRVRGLQLVAEMDLSDTAKLETMLNFSDSLFDNPERFTSFRLDDEAFRFDTSGEIAAIAPVNLSNYQNLSDYINQQKHELNTRTLDEDIVEFSVDYGVNAENQELGWGYKTGIKYRSRTRIFDQGRDRWENPATIGLADVAAVNDSNDFAGCCAPGTFIQLDEGLVDSLIVADINGNNVNGWQFFDSEEDEDNDNQADYDFDEEVFAAYGLGSFNGDRYRVIFGARYEATDYNTTGRIENNLFTIDGNVGIYQNNTIESDYDAWLPSVLFSYDILEDLKVRASFSKSLGRAPFDDLAGNGEVRIDSDDSNVINVTEANTDLQPRESKNYDVSLEWYLDDGDGILSAGLFYKDIKNDFFDLKTTIDDFNAQTGLPQAGIESRITRPTNLQDPVEILGLEINFVKQMDFILEGLDFSINGTALDTDFTVVADVDDVNGNPIQIRNDNFDTLPGQAEDSINMALSYENSGFSAKVAYNRTGVRLDTLRADEPDRDRYRLAREKIDLKFGYKFNSNYRIGFDVWNLTNEPRRQVLGRSLGLELNQSYRDYGRAYFLSFSYTL